MKSYSWLENLDDNGLNRAYYRHCAGRRYNKLSQLGIAESDELDRRLIKAHPEANPKAYREWLSNPYSRTKNALKSIPGYRPRTPEPNDSEYLPGCSSRVSYFYTMIPFALAIVGFFMLPLPWYLALPAALGIYVIGLIPLMVKCGREDRRLGL